MTNNCLPFPPFCFLVDIPFNLFPLWFLPLTLIPYQSGSPFNSHSLNLKPPNPTFISEPYTHYTVSSLLIQNFILVFKYSSLNWALLSLSLSLFINTFISVFTPPISINLSQCHELLSFFTNIQLQTALPSQYLQLYWLH